MGWPQKVRLVCVIACIINPLNHGFPEIYDNNHASPQSIIVQNVSFELARLPAHWVWVVEGTTGFPTLWVYTVSKRK